jgi:hypothetical protein
VLSENDYLTYLGIFEALIYPSLVLSVCGVKVILDAVVRATWELLGDVRPLVAEQLVQTEYLMLLLSVNRILLDVGVQMIMPPIKIQEIRAKCSGILTFHDTACLSDH